MNEGMNATMNHEIRHDIVKLKKKIEMENKDEEKLAHYLSGQGIRGKYIAMCDANGGKAPKRLKTDVMTENEQNMRYSTVQCYFWPTDLYNQYPHMMTHMIMKSHFKV